MSRFSRYNDPVAAAEACGAHILSLLESAVGSGAPATLAISGGSSPVPMFRFFARTPFPWDRVQLFWVDERCVPPDHPQSNFKLANDTWLVAAKFPPGNIHRVRTELPAREAARSYADEIDHWFRPQDGEMPRFDVIHLGMGADGHTASLFPGEPLIQDRRSLTATVNMPETGQARVTLLPGVLEAARNTAMLVIGADKAKVLDAVLRGPHDAMKYPAQIALDSAKATWFADKAAASLLPIEWT
ncbi:MAG: 6-phosphogluconolactonase [Bryobacteraceae bacterium]